MPFRPELPRQNHQQKERDITPVQQNAETHARFAKEDGEQRNDRCRVDETMNTLGQTSERTTNPETEKPMPATMSILVPAQRAKDRAGDNRAEDRLGHDDPRQKECPAGTKINQSGE